MFLSGFTFPCSLIRASLVPQHEQHNSPRESSCRCAQLMLVLQARKAKVRSSSADLLNMCSVSYHSLNYKASLSLTTTFRVGRSCNYEEDVISPSSSSGSGHSVQRNFAVIPGTRSRHSLDPTNLLHDLYVDPFLHDDLRGLTVNIAMCQKARHILQTVDEVNSIADNYFATAWQMHPIICPVLFRRQIPLMFSEPHGDFIVLCLAVHLLLQLPHTDHGSMQSSLYVTVKTSLALLEATNCTTISALQARLLVTLYEIGHGISPAASITVAGCARIAHALGLNQKSFHNVPSDETGKLAAEQDKRARWGTIMLDR
jgi:hypothetical protein